MYEWMFFIHLAGLAIWFGVTLMGVLMLLSVRKTLAVSGVATVAQQTIRNINRLSHPSAFLVLASGLYMILQLDRDGLPFWISFMEQAGGMVILLFIIVMSILGSKLRKKLAQAEPSVAAKSIGSYATWTAIFLLAVLIIILVVSLKL